MEEIVYGMLLLTSIVGLSFIIERGLALRWRRVVPPEVEAAVQSCQVPADVPMLKRVCESHGSAMSRLLLSAAAHLDWRREDTIDALETRARHEVAKLERGLVVLEIIVGIAPLMGLVGTILGMMRVFENIGEHGLTEANTLAQGIALILRATLAGLLIAIPALVFWSYYTKKVENLAIEMETLSEEFLRRQYRFLTPPADTPRPPEPEKTRKAR